MQLTSVRCLVVAGFLLSHLAVTCPASEPLARPSELWKEKKGPTPEFRRHVVPLLGRLGCNNRACHGSFQGQNGFRLSLFGHDPKMDYAELTEDEGEGARVDRQNPAESLMLRKPLGTDEHEGGLRIDEGSWQHHLLFSWIERGATFGERESELERLELRPSELRLKLSSGAKTNLRSVAHFSDGSSEELFGRLLSCLYCPK